MMSQRISVRDVQTFERPTVLRMPFRFGVVTLREAPQIFVRVRIEDDQGRSAWGIAAEMLAPKWFDKSPELSNEDNFDQLRRAVGLASDAYLASDAMSPFDLMARNYADIRAEGAKTGLNPLTAGFGPAQLDRAVADAFCRLHEVPFSKAVQSNLLGINSTVLARDLAGFDLDSYLTGLRFMPKVYARHTVGMLDPLTAADQTAEDRVDDGLPETLEEVIDRYGHSYFKIKVGGDLRADVDRLQQIAAVLDRKCGTYHLTLDGNEQYDTAEGVAELLAAMEATPSLDKFNRSILLIEQPIKRAAALNVDMSGIAEKHPVIIDESDGEFDTFVEAKARGYSGVSSKCCKGFYKSIINGARCAAWNAAEGSDRYFLSAEDLTCQGGGAVQQDLALISLLGIRHIERNGHHYVKGLAGSPDVEQAAIYAGHPDLYKQTEDGIRVNIEGGEISIGSLDCIGFAINAELSL